MHILIAISGFIYMWQVLSYPVKFGCRYKIILQVSWAMRVTTERVLELMSVHLIRKIYIGETSYFGHHMRHKEYKLLQVMLQGIIEEKEE